MLGIIGHDLRNPLTAVASAGLQDTKSIDEVRSIATRIQRSSAWMQRMISDLLDLARSRFGAKMPTRPELIDLAEVANACVDELRLAHPERAVSFQCRGDVAGVWDRDRMAQVVSNLVANAIQPGAIRLTWM